MTDRGIELLAIYELYAKQLWESNVSININASFEFHRAAAADDEELIRQFLF